MTLRRWRNETALIDAAQKLHANKTFMQVMNVLKHELPTNHALPVSGASAHDFSYAYGVEVGYRRAIAVIEATAINLPETEQVEAKYEQKQ